MTAAHVVLWRHGQTDWNLSGRYQGQGDQPLNAVGIEQARVVAPLLAGMAPARVLSSDLQRARVTAEALCAISGNELEIDPRLQEINVGHWVGMTKDEIYVGDPGFQRALAAGGDWRRSPTGETGAEAGSRVALALLDLAESVPDGSTVVAVGHGFSMRIATTMLLGLNYTDNHVLAGLRNCSWTILQPLGERWRLVSYNHVADAAPR
ncbi:MAG: histidine phosphatase family protein [Micropruina sp.]|nr:histidine phosphatase family protein [Micropruina sp.]